MCILQEEQLPVDLMCALRIFPVNAVIPTPNDWKMVGSLIFRRLGIAFDNNKDHDEDDINVLLVLKSRHSVATIPFANHWIGERE